MNKPLPEIGIPEGYSLHNMVDEANLNLEHKIARMTGAFGDPEPYPIEIYRNMQSGPSYRKDFDIYTTDRDGNVTSFCIIWYDEELKIGYFEPVGTDTNHRRKSLGKRTLNAGLKLLKQAGASKAFVGATGTDKRDFYSAAGFIDSIAFYPWLKELT